MRKSPQRAGAGGNRCEYLLRGISLLSLSPKCAGRTETAEESRKSGWQSRN